MDASRFDVIVVDTCREQRQPFDLIQFVQQVPVLWVEPKPTVYQGKYRLTKEDYWAKSNAINTAACLAKGEFIAFVDDRSVILPGWLRRLDEAMRGNYAVAGTYSKRINLKVEHGFIVDAGTVIGSDSRLRRGQDREPIQTYGEAWFGCNNAMPLEWLLNINGADESADSLGYEDVLMGHMLIRNGYVTKFDPQMAVVQDRTMPESESSVKRTDKGISPADKSHGLEIKTSGCKRATHHWDLPTVRANVQAGQPFPAADYPTFDWWDNQPLKDFP